MSNLGIKKGTRRFKPKGRTERSARPVETKQPPTESQVKETQNRPEAEEPSRKRPVADEQTPCASLRRMPATTKVPLSIVQQTLDEYQSPPKKIRPLGLPKEELRRLAEKETKEKEELAQQQEELKIHAPQVKLVNGEIVFDESSLWIDHPKDNEEREVVEETEHIKMKRGPNAGPRTWTHHETDLFYELLEEFGIDFEAISKRIPGRSRSQVQRKYKAEYSRHPSKVNSFLHK